MRTYQQIKASVIKMGYSWAMRPNELNFVWERVNFEATNKFKLPRELDSSALRMMLGSALLEQSKKLVN